MIRPATTFVDPETLSSIDLVAIGTMVQRFRGAASDAQKRTIANQLTRTGASLRRVQVDLEKKLNVGLDILLSEDEQTDPDHISKETRWHQWLVDYEAVSDLLSAIQYGVLANRWDLVSSRSPDQTMKAAA